MNTLIALKIRFQAMLKDRKYTTWRALSSSSMILIAPFVKFSAVAGIPFLVRRLVANRVAKYTFDGGQENK